jgi:hypothetical protein
MKKTIFTLINLFFILKLTSAAIINTDVNKTVDSIATQYQLDITGDGSYDLTFNYFANGAITVTGRIGTAGNFYLATATISGNNNYPIKIGNDKSFEKNTTWKSNGIFLQSPSLGYTDFKGKGNQYIGGKLTYTGGIETYYFWVLINVSKDGSSLNIIKCAYENETDVPLLTGNEGATNVSVNEALNNINFTVFPQPASTFLNITCTEKIVDYAIYNLTGKLMANEKLINNEINVAQLPKGIYILKLTTATNFLITKKIIIEN